MTDINVMAREQISEQARAAAQKWAAAAPGAPQPPCPYPLTSDAAAEWKRQLGLHLLRYSAEASA